MRAFISFDVPDNPVLRGLREEAKGRCVSPRNYHICVRFLGGISQERVEKVKKTLRKLAEKFSSFEVNYEKTAMFGSTLVVLLSGFPDKITEFLDNELPEFKEKRRFRAHITLARKSNFVKKRFSYKERLSIIRLKKSTLTREGPVYETLHEEEL